MQKINLVKGKEVLYHVSTFSNEISDKAPSLSWHKAKSYSRHICLVSGRLHLLIVLFILGLTFVYPIMAQQGNDVLVKNNQFRIGLSAGNIHTLDLQVSSKMFQGIRNNLHLDYTRIVNKGIFTTNLNVFIGILSPKGHGLTFYARESDIYGVETTESITLEIAQVGINLELGYLHNLKELKASKTALYVGGSFEENLTYPLGFIYTGLINYGSLNAKLRLDYFITNNKPLVFQLSHPALSVVTRNPYNNSPTISDKSAFETFFTGNNKIETINHFQNFKFSVKYPFWVTKRMTFDIAYEGSWLHYNKAQHLTQLANQFSLGLTF